jgi:hypothetical protein
VTQSGHRTILNIAQPALKKVPAEADDFYFFLFAVAR